MTIDQTILEDARVAMREVSGATFHPTAREIDWFAKFAQLREARAKEASEPYCILYHGLPKYEPEFAFDIENLELYPHAEYLYTSPPQPEDVKAANCDCSICSDVRSREIEFKEEILALAKFRDSLWEFMQGYTDEALESDEALVKFKSLIPTIRNFEKEISRLQDLGMDLQRDLAELSAKSLSLITDKENKA